MGSKARNVDANDVNIQSELFPTTHFGGDGKGGDQPSLFGVQGIHCELPPCSVQPWILCSARLAWRKSRRRPASGQGSAAKQRCGRIVHDIC